MKKSEYEGRQGYIPDIHIADLEVFHNVYEGHDFVVKHTALEFNSVCPKTSLPDFGEISIEFIPDKLCVELKSFKLYLVKFRDLGIFMENSVNKILEDIVKAINPKWCKVVGDFKPRGGVKTYVVREYTCSKEIVD